MDKEIYTNPLEDFSDKDLLGMKSLDSSSDLPHSTKDEHELDDRNKLYTHILKDYSKYIKETLINNNKNKSKFLWTFIFILCGLTIGLISIFGYSVISRRDIDYIPLLTAVISFISAIIIIPSKMTEYLFNPQEVQHINEIIKNIQDYDKAVRDDLFKRDNEDNDKYNIIKK